MKTHITSLSEEIEKDPVLRTYNIKGNDLVRYDASGFFSPISIRDQIVRVCSIIDAALSSGIISPDKRPLLVIGGSIAGVTAAIKATQNGIKTVLVEKGIILEKMLASGRYFSPVQYDWIAEHWELGSFPWKASKSIPVLLDEGSVGRTVYNLKRKILGISAKHPDLLKIYQHTVLKEANPIKITDVWSEEPFSLLKASFENVSNEIPAPLPDTTEFSMALSCTGFGSERVFVENSDFRGYRFWEVHDHNGIIRKGNVLICGSGDGSLQDFLLLSCEKNTAREIYNHLNLNAAQKELLERAIFTAEEKAKRDEIWLNRKSEKSKKLFCSLYSELHRVHLNEVEKLLTSKDVNERLETIVRDEAINGNLKIAYVCDHFSGCYALNRFLTLLIAKYIEKSTGNSPLLENTAVLSIESAESAHTCNNDAETCAGCKHLVTLTQKIGCLPIPTLNRIEDVFQTVFVRYGIDDIKPVFKKEPSFSGLQILPYILP